MFSSNSRYRNLTESVFLNAKGERVRGKELRLIRSPEDRVLHLVTGADSLDLLAYKYYGDTTKWWLISDANPERPFPLDLLDGSQTVEEFYSLTLPNFERRYADLITALKNIGEVDTQLISYFEAGEPAESERAGKPSFLEETVVVTYAPDDRPEILAAIQARGFHRLKSFSFPRAAGIAESFTIDDPEAKLNWHLLIDSLRTTPGILEVQPVLTEATLGLVYNRSMVETDSLSKLIKGRGFIVEVAPSSRIGKKINIPSNQLV